MKGTHSVPRSKYIPGDIVQEAQAFVWATFAENPDSRLVYHSYPFAAEVADRVEEIGAAEKLDPENWEVCRLAAWLLLSGWIKNYQHPFRTAGEEAALFFDDHPFDRAEEVYQCIRAAAPGGSPQTAIEKVVADAWHTSEYVRDYSSRHPILKLERELINGERLTRLEWARLQIQELLSIQLHTSYAQLVYGPELSRNLLLHKQQLEKLSRNLADPDENAPASPGRFQALNSSEYIRSVQTFFRANYRNHINLSAIADNKANIMISVNSILISVLITLISYRNIAETQPVILLPVVIFLVTGLASLIFAVLSARPKVTSLNAGKHEPAVVKKNIVFFGNFVTLDLEQYEEAMDEMFRDGELLYGNMTRDLYHLGKVLDKKYRYLTVSYNIFMIGFVTTVLTFLFALFK